MHLLSHEIILGIAVGEQANFYRSLNCIYFCLNVQHLSHFKELAFTIHLVESNNLLSYYALGFCRRPSITTFQIRKRIVIIRRMKAIQGNPCFVILVVDFESFWYCCKWRKCDGRTNYLFYAKASDWGCLDSMEVKQLDCVQWHKVVHQSGWMLFIANNLYMFV